MVTGLVTGEVLSNMEVQYTGTISYFTGNRRERKEIDFIQTIYLLNDL